jgi:hypothetical protein
MSEVKSELHMCILKLSRQRAILKAIQLPGRRLNMGSKKYYCVREAAEFPASEFGLTGKGALVHRLGAEANWHYAATGEPVSGVSHPVILGISPKEKPDLDGAGILKENDL